MKTKFSFRPVLRIGVLSFLLLVLFLAATAYADTVNPIPLSQAVAMALKNDFQIETALQNLEKAKLAVNQEVIKLYPQGTVENTLGYHMLENGGFQEALTVTLKESYPTKYNLYGNKIPTTLEVAVWDQLSSETQLQITQANVIYNTISLYLNALKAEKAIALQEATVKNSQTSLTLAQQQLKLGNITKPTELKAETDFANANFNLQKSRSDYTLALHQLENQLGFKDGGQFELVDTPDNMIPEVIDLKEIAATATQKRLELKQAQITMQKAERQLAQMQNQALPDLNLSYNYSNTDRTLNFNIGYSFLSGNINGNAQTTLDSKGNSVGPDNTTNNFTLKFTWNADFGTANNQIDQAKLGVKSAEDSQRQTLQGIQWDVEQAYANYVLARQKAENNAQTIPFYQKQLEIVNLQCKLGLATQLDVATNEANLFQAQLQVVNSKYDLLAAYEKLKLVSGELYQFEIPATLAKK